MTQHFTFREEMLEKYDEDSYEMVMGLFDAMPLAGKIEQKFICMHGGISPDLNKIDQINSINRFQEVPLEGLYW
jgi:serine/threonine-protein phosphatase 2B catalytic subunit